MHLTRKRPDRHFGGNASMSFGRWDRRRLAGDLSVPITADGGVRALVALSGESGDGFRDRETIDRRAGLFHLEADLGERTRLNAGYQTEATRMGGASWGANVPIWFSGGSLTDLPRSTNPVADWSTAKRSSATTFAGLTRLWDNGWTLTANVARTRNEAWGHYGIVKPNNLSGSRFGGFWNQDGSGGHLNAFHTEGDGVRDNVDVTLTIPLHVARREHQLMVGFNGYEAEAPGYTFNRALCSCAMGSFPTYNAGSCQYRAGAYVIDDWRTWDGSAPALRTFRTHARNVDTTRLYGGYVAGRFELAEPLHLVVGARLSQYRTWRDSYDAANASTRGNADRESDVVTPYAGIVYDISPNFSLYASHTDVFTPQGDVRDANDRRLDPLTGKSQEAGIKGEFFDGALNSSLSVFRNLQDGLAESTNVLHPETGLTVYRAVDGVKSKGYLQSAGLRTSTAAGGDAMWARLDAGPVDLLVLDIMLPGTDGLTLCGQLRRGSQVPVIMLTARGRAIDRIAGLELGADDYMAKPFEPRELLARIRGIPRRSGHTGGAATPARTLHFAGWTFDSVTRQLRAPDGRIVSLGGADYRLLHVLLQSPNRAVDRDTLIDHVYGRDRTPVDRAIDVCISRLRQQLV
ncbi:hypothetical protein CMZ84_12495 [Lysobacteraceae bacterium NML93-0399]|nr:hypothetical protein CMZ84_12495 [Xanthomonadaceae bacterium NML93-0399]